MNLGRSPVTDVFLRVQAHVWPIVDIWGSSVGGEEDMESILAQLTCSITWKGEIIPWKEDAVFRMI